MQKCLAVKSDMRLFILFGLMLTLHLGVLGQWHWEPFCWEKVSKPSHRRGGCICSVCQHLQLWAESGLLSSDDFGWFLQQRDIHIWPHRDKDDILSAVNGSCPLTQAAPRPCDQFITQDCKIASCQCESWRGSRRISSSISPPTTNCLAAE